MGIRQGHLRFECDSAFLKVLLAMACAPAVASPQLSSGSLFKAHRALEGPTHCDSCHVGDRREREFRCLPCHSEIRRLLAANRGLHPSLMHAGPPDVQCVKCHSDHNGEDFVPIHWDVPLDEFDHRKTGYPLDGGHAHLKCSQCHNPDHIACCVNSRRNWTPPPTPPAPWRYSALRRRAPTARAPCTSRTTENISPCIPARSRLPARRAAAP